MSDARVLGDFEGRWQLDRAITQRDGMRARFTGTALWRVQGQGMLYTEEGHLVMSGQAPMKAERRYFWQDDLSVFFDDGRFFHKVPATGGQTDHWCDPDSYQGAYDFSDWPKFAVRWDVTGPRKAYCSESLYSRC